MFIQGLVVKLTKQKKENSLAQYLLDTNRNDFSIVLLVRLLDSLKKIFTARKERKKQRKEETKRTKLVLYLWRLVYSGTRKN